MRCLNCGVDLGEGYTRCPLCGSKASDEEPVLKGFVNAEYPQYDESTAYKKTKFKCSFPLKYLLRGVLILCTFFGIAALFGFEKLWTIGVPVSFVLTAAVYFFNGLLEKGRLLHSAVASLATLASAGVFTLVSLIAKCGVSGMVDSLLVCLAFFLLLWAIRPKRVKEQMKALFVL